MKQKDWILKVQNYKLRTVSVGCSQLIHTLSTCCFKFLVRHLSRNRYSQHCGYNGKICGRQQCSLWISLAYNVYNHNNV